VTARSSRDGAEQRERDGAGTVAGGSGRHDTVETDDATVDSTPNVEHLDLLVVGTFAGGGIHRYIDEQVERLQDAISIRTHDMASPPIGNGWQRFAMGVFFGLLAMARFPTYDRPDLVHVHTSHRFSFYRSSVYVLYAKHVWQVPVILHIHGSSFDEFVQTDSWLVAALQRRIFASSDSILVLSEYWQDIVAERAGTGPVRVFPNAVDPSTFPVARHSPYRDTGDQGETPHVVFVSNLIERKGVLELVPAIEALADAHPGAFRVSIAGDGPLSPRVERLADEYEEVEYLGYVSEERKRSLLAEGSIYVLPTHAEGLPIAMLEGMAGENAIMTTTVGSIPEVIDDDRGILFEPGDVAALTEALETLLADPERRARMAENNRRATESTYSWDRIRADLLELYAEHATRSRGQ